MKKGWNVFPLNSFEWNRCSNKEQILCIAREGSLYSFIKKSRAIHSLTGPTYRLKRCENFLRRIIT
ncbi:MAG: hypothetical protein KDK61_03560 [Simkania sp.]|nr:hypothetical protein [Simkania sp.]MCB1074483.1 hypothetical protein [Simkania sp.]MCB1083362.1 hypothetical protein [Simkania sp.]MCP5490689.1 hypothetical protein [Chlamydiales bacterium]